MTVTTYKHFKKENEVILGLDFWTLAKVFFLTLLLAFSAFLLKLPPNSPFFLLLAIVWMIVVVFIVKSSLDDEVSGYYSSLLYFPFANHIFPFMNKKDMKKAVMVGDQPEALKLNHHYPEFYQSLYSKLNIKSIEDNFLVTKEGDLVAYIKLNNGICPNRHDQNELEKYIANWGDLLAGLKSVTSLKSSLVEFDNLSDSVQVFTKVNNYKFNKINLDELKSETASEVSNVFYSHKKHKTWQKKYFSEEKFIPDLDFYLIIRHKKTSGQINFFHKQAKKFLPKFFPKDYTLYTEDDLEEQLTLLNEKIRTTESLFAEMGINTKRLKGEDLKSFVDTCIPFSNLVDGQNNKQGQKKDRFIVRDQGRYLEIDGKFHKTYRISSPPSTGDLNLWLVELKKRISLPAWISVHYLPRNATNDRRRAEQKSEFLKQNTKTLKTSTQKIIQENQNLASELMHNPNCFDLMIYLTVSAEDLDQLQKVDNFIKRPIKDAFISSLDRQQLNNWLYSLPFAHCKLKQKDTIFASQNFAAACFNFIKSELGTRSGPLLGQNLEDERPVYLNEYDRSVCNNRGFNFIGDSGSGKTVAAKLAIKRRLSDDSKFFIVDNTADGWKFFLDYFGGDIITIDQEIKLQARESLFTPFNLSSKDEIEVNDHIEKIIYLLALMNDTKIKLSSLEKSFLQKSLKSLYNKYESPILSDLYNEWSSSEDPNSSRWAAIVAPFARSASGIYAYLLDGSKSVLNDKSSLILFTFSKVHRDSNFQSLGLGLIANFINQRVISNRETKTTFIIDEAWKLFGDANCPQAQELVSHFARAGRGLDLGLWTISQKPSDLPREIHSSASCLFSFQMKENMDKDDLARFSNLKESERKLLASKEITESGTCLFKTSRASSLVKINLDPIEEVICNSTRDFVNKRDEIFNHYHEALSEQYSGKDLIQICARRAVEELIPEEKKLLLTNKQKQALLLEPNTTKEPQDVRS